MKPYIISVCLFITFALTSCNQNPDDNSINLFSIEDDKALGQQLDAEILSMPAEYPILSEAAFPGVYSYIYGLRDSLLNGGNIYYATEFPWVVRIIHDDSTLNAFATPGGYVYIYTGLMKYLDSEDALIGVMGHEFAHADRRHSTDQLTKIYGIQILLSVVLGDNQGLLSDIATSLAALQFSRDNEAEADEYSVRYLCPTSYNAAGAAVFFEKIQNAGGSQPPVFLSTHPDPGSRVQAIHDLDNTLGCSGTQTYDQRYANFLSMLP